MTGEDMVNPAIASQEEGQAGGSSWKPKSISIYYSVRTRWSAGSKFSRMSIFSRLLTRYFYNNRLSRVTVRPSNDIRTASESEKLPLGDGIVGCCSTWGRLIAEMANLCDSEFSGTCVPKCQETAKKRPRRDLEPPRAHQSIADWKSLMKRWKAAKHVGVIKPFVSASLISTNYYRLQFRHMHLFNILSADSLPVSVNVTIN